VGLKLWLKPLVLIDALCDKRASCSCSIAIRLRVWKDSLCIDPLRSWKERPLAWEKDDACRGATCENREKASAFGAYCACSTPCLDGGKLPFRDGAPLDGAKYSDAAMLRRSSLGECTEAASGHDVTPVSGRCWLPSDWPNPKFANPVLSESI
jgi:hypothetical protein